MTITRIDQDGRMSQIVIHGGVVYLSGQVGNPGEDVSAQTRSTLAEIDALLAQAGTDKAHLLHATIWLADIADFDAMNVVWEEWIGGGNAPTRATGEVTLASPDYKVEIIVTAALPG
ncbi:RidA family protein [Sphingomonas sp.]|jgi:enamine deaminase RidA (YjgF/YER057c/UK114 family)|uniref:RidA family protein n=1 Tax=Sphingomonas sp. TaxID=28214 RepID=UPI002619EE56|nr:RidA family protein [Sphingomonas sp.]MDF2494601.1 endoribonuclease [Sphingomonas sp.]